MWRPTNAQWWILIATALLIVFAWPPRDDKRLALKFVNWVVDPRGELPVLPNQLALGQGDDPDAVSAPSPTACRPDPVCRSFRFRHR